jgi:hypothetical protein
LPSFSDAFAAYSRFYPKAAFACGNPQRVSAVEASANHGQSVSRVVARD